MPIINRRPLNANCTLVNLEIYIIEGYNQCDDNIQNTDSMLTYFQLNRTNFETQEHESTFEYPLPINSRIHFYRT